jgi:MFS family permease
MHPPERVFGLPARQVATGAVLLGLVVAAFEGTIITSAMPTVARELGGLSLYGWVFSAFLVASMVGVLVCGKLADAYGRRPVFAAGMGLFLIGSILCGAATSLPALVAFRVIQGVGAGAIQPIAMTISSDIYTLEERARIQALFTSVWGGSCVIGPVLGGWITTHLSWRWVFLVNVPIGALAVVVLLASYRDPPQREVRAVGTRGALLGGLAAGLLLVGLEPLALAVRAVVLGLAAALTIAFVRDQRRSPAPILAPDLLPDRVVRAGLVGGVFTGALLYTCAAYVPLWTTVHARGTPLVAGLALVPLLAGWAFGSSFGVKVLVRCGMRASVAGGFAIAVVGALSLAIVTHAEATISPTAAAAALAVLGVGLGPAASTSLVAPQNHVPWRQRGAITSAVYASRALGGSIAVAAVGALPLGAAGTFDPVALLALLGFGTLLLLAPAGVLSPKPA